MSAFYYVAKRQLVPTTFSVDATDATVDGTLNTFNTTVHDFSGLVLNDWIYVTGFVNPENNGWHVVASTSTTTSIAVTSNLVTETVATVIFQGYFHRFGLSYSLESSMEKLDESSEQIANTSITLGGLTQSVLNRIDDKWHVKTTWITDANKPFWVEFMKSVMGSEPFILDPYGSIAVPDEQFAVILDSKPSWDRVQRLSDLWTLSFTVRVL